MKNSSSHSSFSEKSALSHSHTTSSNITHLKSKTLTRNKTNYISGTHISKILNSSSTHKTPTHINSYSKKHASKKSRLLINDNNNKPPKSKRESIPAPSQALASETTIFLLFV